MTPSLAFWTLALVDLLGVVVCAAFGVARIRRSDVRGHRRLMLGAVSLVGVFLVSYGLKLVFLGREPLHSWNRASLASLYVHETCIAVMLLSGGVAGAMAWRFRHTTVRETGAERSRDRTLHGRAGRLAVGASLLAFASACGMLWGMYAQL